jgi:hypothetical protein
MNGTHWTIVAYVAGLGLMWGYALALWVAGRSARSGEPRS